MWDAQRREKRASRTESSVGEEEGTFGKAKEEEEESGEDPRGHCFCERGERLFGQGEFTRAAVGLVGETIAERPLNGAFSLE